MTCLSASTVCVFAYGSNMCVERIQARVPGATPIASGRVSHRKFVFHKRSIDGSAKADAVFTGLQTDHIWGVAYRLPADEKPILDRHEFLGIGYNQEEVDVVLETGPLRAWIYVARGEVIDPSLQPYSWYHDFVIHGALQHRLPGEYIESLRQFESMTDPNLARHEQNQRLIKTGS